ncbi:hypothetical protein [Propionivibrio limicola]|uniref:hypothetical protein n=1 Tax=Propionivibrio limicola TaxID=167645 RepID=UPI00129116F6|nr:hypothetical protein [Propionivibrio limicola]
MSRFNNQGLGQQKMGGGRGRCLRDASGMSSGRNRGQGQRAGQCNGLGQRGQFSGAGRTQGQGMFGRFLGLTGQRQNMGMFSTDWINSAIEDLQQQINNLREQLRK